MEILEIDLSLIQENPYQPRQSFDAASLNELAQSILANGLIQPIVVRPQETGYQLIAGDRRLKAFKLLKRKKIPAMVVVAGDDASENLSLIENIQRLDLNPMEEALAFQSLLANQKITQEQLAKKIGKSQSAIANKLRLLQLIPEVKEALANRKISERHGRSLLGLNVRRQKELLNKVLNEDLNVAQLEKIINAEKPVNKRSFTRKDSQLRLAINTINEAIDLIRNAGIKVSSEEKDKKDIYQITIKIKKPEE